MIEKFSLKDRNGGIVPWRTDLKWAYVDVLKSINSFNKYAFGYPVDLPEIAYHRQDVGCHIEYSRERKVQRYPRQFLCDSKDQLNNYLSFLTSTDGFIEKAVEPISDWYIPDNGVLVYQHGNYKYSDSVGDGNLDWKVDKWFCHNFPQQQQNGESNYSSTEGRSIKIMNVEQETLNNVAFGPDHCFHGTDWESVESILSKGISSDFAKGNSDFSNIHRPGFYVSHTFKEAKEWAKKRSSPAVIVFKTDTSFFNGDRHLNFLGNQEEQLQLFQHFKHGKDLDEILKTRIENCLSIRGRVVIPGSVHEGPNVRYDFDETCIYFGDNGTTSCTHRRLVNSIECVFYYARQETLRRGRRYT